MEKLLRLPEVAELTGLPVNTLRFWRHQGTGPKSGSWAGGRPPRVRCRGMDRGAVRRRVSKTARCSSRCPTRCPTSPRMTHVA